MKRIIFFIIVLGLLISVMPLDLEGVPAFARKHKLSCKTCHDPFPRLKPFGDEFAGNGFTIDDKVPSRYHLDTGDDKLSLMRSFPIALRLDLFVTRNKYGEEVTDISSPYNVKLVSGGVIAKNVSYYFYFFFSERGEIAGLEDAFIMFNDVFGTGVSFALGQFQISDPLFKGELKLTFEDYMIYRVRPGFSHLDLKYDRGVMLSYTIPKGGPDIVLELLNGTGIHGADEFKNYDDDSFKNIFGRVSQDIGEHFRVGAAAFYGRESADGITNKVNMFGGDFTLSLYPLEINFQYVDRTDDNPYLAAIAPGDFKTRGGLLEMIYTFGGVDSPWYAAGLYNWVDSDDELQNYQSAAVHFGYLFRRNIRFLAEMDYIFKSNYGEYLRVVTGIIAAF